MKKRGMMLFVVLGLVPFLMAFRFGGEISYPNPTKFQVNSDGNSGFENIVVGDVDGDGDQDLIMIYVYKNSSTEAHNEVRLYLNQNAELGGPGPTPLGIAQTPLAINTLFSNSNTSGTGNMYVIYQDGVSGTQTVDAKLWRGDSSSADVRSFFTGLTAAYKVVNGKKVVDYVLVSRQYGSFSSSAYSYQNSYNPRHYAGRIIHLKNPYSGANPNDVKGAWWKRNGTTAADVHPGNANSFTSTTPPDSNALSTDPVPTISGIQFYNDDYTWQQPYHSDTWDGPARGTFNAIQLADLDGNGNYDLYAAPRFYVSGNMYPGDTIATSVGEAANIYQYLNPNDGTNDFNNAYNDSSPGKSIWSDTSTGVIVSQFAQFRLVDMDKDGIPDLLGAQSSNCPLSWIKGKNNSDFLDTSCCDIKKARLNSAGTFWDINAGNLRVPTSGSGGDNNRGIPDLVLTRSADAQIEISMYSDAKNNADPAWSSYADFQAIYTAPTSETTDPTNIWMYKLKFGRVVIADVDNCGENEIIVTIWGHTTNAGGRTAQYWIFKKNTTKYLTMNFNELQ